MLLLSVQSDKFHEHLSLVCSCSAFSGTNSKNTGHCCVHAPRSVGPIPRRPVTAVLLLSVQWDNFQEHRSLLWSCLSFSETNSKKTGDCRAPAQRSVRQIPRRAVTVVLLLSVQSDTFQEDRSLLCSYSSFSGTNSKKTDDCCALVQRSVGQIPRTPVSAVHLLSVQLVRFQKDRSLMCSCSAVSGTKIPRRQVTAAHLFSVQWDKFQEGRSLLYSCSTFSGTNSKKTSHCCALVQHSVGQIPRRPVTAVLLFSVQWDKFQEGRSLLYSCSTFSWTNSKKTSHCCALIQHSVGQIPRRPVTAVLLFSVQLDKFQEDRSLLCSCAAFSRTKCKKTDHWCALARSSVGQIPKRPITVVLMLSRINCKKSGHCCVLAQRPVGQIPKRTVTDVLLFSGLWDKFLEERLLLYSYSVFSGANSKKTGHWCALVQRSVGQIPRRPVTAVLLLSVQRDKFQETSR